MDRQLLTSMSSPMQRSSPMHYTPGKKSGGLPRTLPRLAPISVPSTLLQSGESPSLNDATILAGAPSSVAPSASVAQFTKLQMDLNAKDDQIRKLRDRLAASEKLVAEQIEQMKAMKQKSLSTPAAG
eukprot:SAG31_NODE_10181_length_1174_cov_1.306977_1_plen_127_part_00